MFIIKKYYLIWFPISVFSFICKAKLLTKAFYKINNSYCSLFFSLLNLRSLIKNFIWGCSDSYRNKFFSFYRIFRCKNYLFYHFQNKNKIPWIFWNGLMGQSHYVKIPCHRKPIKESNSYISLKYMSLLAKKYWDSIWY